jgi:hypothetical protein
VSGAVVSVARPVWSGPGSGTYPGRFPLSVERHVMNTVDRLVPGVTTVTLNARYYALHGLVAAEASNRDLDAAAAQELLRRAGVAMGPCPLATCESSPMRTKGSPGRTATTR